MPATWLLVDFGFLAWRAFYGSARDDVSSVVPHVAATVRGYQQRFSAHARTVLCFDSGPYHRADIFPGYKAKRKAKNHTDYDADGFDWAPDKDRPERVLRNRLAELPYELLNEGHKVLVMGGFEADDHIAAAVAAVPKEDHSVVVSRDKDLWQLLSARVSQLDPVTEEIMTRDTFRARHDGLHPSEWVDVKAIAGCATDDIPGIPGVAEKTAVKYLTGKMNRMSPTYQKIINFVGTAAHVNNIALCRLPFPGTPPVRLV